MTPVPKKSLSDEQLTRELASRVMGWKIAPGRFIKQNRGWTPMSRFKPLMRIEDAFRLLDLACAKYRLMGDVKGRFDAEVRIGLAKGRASGTEKARVITIALARALGIEVSA
jgi:hypothetical protein